MARSSSEFLGAPSSEFGVARRPAIYRIVKAQVIISCLKSSESSSSRSEWLGVAWRSSRAPRSSSGVLGRPPLGVAQSAAKQFGVAWKRIASSSEPLQECCLLARESTIEKLRSKRILSYGFKMGPASAVCEGAGSTLPRERNGPGRRNDRNDRPPTRPKIKNK